MNKLVIGILAHVDAGKTTLSEGMLYLTGTVKKTGRVDHGDAFLDTDALERERGITIFAKQAVFSLGKSEVTLLDTPGHIDFSAEMERTLSVLDCAILVVSGTDGVQGHTQTLWRLLRRHGIPVLLFINKMDLPGADREALLQELRARLDEGCIDFGADADSFAESIAMTDEALLERYLSGAPTKAQEIAARIVGRRIFPCYFGAALRMEGIQDLLDGIAQYVEVPDYPADFGARVFKISRDEQGARLTHLKVTGGTLGVRAALTGTSQNGDVWQQKVNQIRIYSGAKYKLIDEAPAGTICAVTGLGQTYAGMGLGAAAAAGAPVLEPVLTYRVLLPEGCDLPVMLKNLRQLEEEDPQLRVLWNEVLSEIHIQLMGEVQLEVLTRMIAERFSVSVAFDTGSIVYKETIAAPALGIGHFEPLRHYAEVHLLLEPGERGSGLQFASSCSVDMLEESWQRLVLTHLAEKAHVGVLIGSALTDVKITLLAGRGHVKHTDGGDFRQATYRAVRQALMQAKNVLLEPTYAFRLEVPQDAIGRAMTDLQRMHASFDAPEIEGDRAVLIGQGSVATLRDYWTEVAAYTKGHGQLFSEVKGYAPCHNEAEIVQAQGYDPLRDLDNSPDSIFCEHGVGYTVKWDEVAVHAHIDARWHLPGESPTQVQHLPAADSKASDLEEELEEIFVRTYGPIKNRGFDALGQSRKRRAHAEIEYLARVRPDDYLLVDGYNIIFAWDELSQIAADHLDAARAALIHILSSYQGVKRCNLILVFDAYRVKGNPGTVEKHANISVVYTREAQTADMYIERASYELSRRHRVKVATSDALEQLIILGHGAERISANELKWEVEQARLLIEDFMKKE